MAIGEEGGLDVLVAAVRRRLAAAGARVVPVLHPDGAAQAAAANAARRRGLPGVTTRPRQPGLHGGVLLRVPLRVRRGSAAGRARPGAGSRPALSVPAHGARGMSLPLLRETRMPAVVCEMGPPAAVARGASALSEAVATALATWADTPVD